MDQGQVSRSRRRVAYNGAALALLGLSTIVQQSEAAPQPSSSTGTRMGKRKMILSDSDITTIGGKIPMDLILLIGVTMAIAVLCIVIALLNIRFPWVAGSRVISEERSRARTDLRLRGAGRHVVVEPKRSRFGVTSTLSEATVDSKSQLLSPTGTPDLYRKPAAFVGPRVAQDRSSRSLRGYSFYNKQDIVNGPRRPPTHRSLTSSLAVPVLPRKQTDNASDSSSSAAGYSAGSKAGVIGPRPLPSHARPVRTRTSSGGVSGRPEHSRRISSTTVGRGTNTFGRSHDRQYRTELPLPPQLADPAYGSSTDRSSPRGKLSGRYELHRVITDPRDSTSNSRRNSTSNSPVRSPSYFDGSGSETHSCEGYQSSPGHHPLQSTSQLPRTRPLALYDMEADYPGNHLTSLLHGSQAPQTSKNSWRSYA